MAKNQHVVKHPDGWAAKGAGNQRATRVVPTQRQAADIARDTAKNQGTEVLIHGRNGQIRSKDSYGEDPNPPRDTEH